MNNGDSLQKSDILENNEDFLRLKNNTQKIKVEHNNQLVEALKNIQESGNKKKVMYSEQIIDSTIDKILQEFYSSPNTFYGLDLAIIKKYYDILKKEESDSTQELFKCAYIFDKMKTQDIILLSKITDTEKFINFLTDNIISNIRSYYKKNHTKELSKGLIESIQINIEKLENYSLVKKNKKYLSTISQLEKHLALFLQQQDEGIRKIIGNYFISQYENCKVFDQSEKKEFFVALTPFIFEFFYDFENFYMSFISYVYEKWEILINEELTKQQSGILPNQIKKEKKNTLKLQIFDKEVASSIKTLSEEQIGFINEVEDVFQNKKIKSQLGNYLKRILRNNESIRIWDWAKSKNITLTDDEYQRIESLFRQYNYVEYSETHENSDREELMIDPQIDGILETDSENNIEEDISVHSINDALSYFKNKFGSVFIDEDSLVKQYDLLLHLYQENFLYTVKKAIQNPKLWKKQSNGMRKLLYYKLDLQSGYRFAREKKTGRIFLGSHEDYEDWLRVKG